MIFFVTGGSRGIGEAIVLEAAAQGHDVAFTYRTNEAAAQAVKARVEQTAPKVKCEAYQLDVRVSSEVEAVGEKVVDDFETVDVVVNNAGASRPNMLAFMSDEEWEDVIATNLTGAFYVCRQLIPTLLSNKYGRIINISSVVAEGSTGQANYSAAKAGLHGLTKTIAKEYGRKNITANVLALGFFDTDMTREQMPEKLAKFWKDFCPRPKGRVGHLFEVTRSVTYLASEDAGFVNGQVIRLTGGMDWAY
jgi:NAD(P)-dependent dehydrogenase (short-subunit alcohol dehydrogenase family)